MRISGLIIVACVVFAGCSSPENGKTGRSSISDEISLAITKKYLNLPVSNTAERAKISFRTGGRPDLNMVMRLAQGKPDYWVFLDMEDYRGKILKIKYEGNPAGLHSVYQDDTINGQDSLYRESNRPQIHFTTRRGWNNDPNGLVWFDGKYHLFYQHNPLERNWENMSWGHAVSNDLVHWKELSDALLPDSLGTIFSGSAVIDKENTSGWGKNTMVLFYTSAGKKMKQCIAYSTDSGKTFTKYAGNPVIGPDRDPRVFWYAPGKHWVLVLYNENYNMIYNSTDLKNWEFKSKVDGFYECPELFELPVDGKAGNSKWVMYGASGTYMTGTFDGMKFTPEHGKYFYTWGCQYAAQTYNNTPDGRRIQIGWGRVDQKNMPFNQMMLFPCELTLRTTPDGIRLFCEPVREIEKLHRNNMTFKEISGTDVNEKIKEIRSGLLHITADIEVTKGLGFEILFRGNTILTYDGNFGLFNGAPYVGNIPGSLRFNIEMLIDKTSYEAYIGNGRLFIPEALKEKKSEDGLFFRGDIRFHSMVIHELGQIWN
jgi:fructan beta-fructosidase